MMPNNRFDSSAHRRLITMSDQIGELNSRIVRNLSSLNSNPELVDELIRCCDTMLAELKEIKSASASRFEISPIPTRGSNSGSGLSA